MKCEQCYFALHLLGSGGVGSGKVRSLRMTWLCVGQDSVNHRDGTLDVDR